MQMLRTIYLDNSATTPVRPEVREAMMPFLLEKWGNPSSVHFYGRDARRHIDEARRSVATLLGCEEDEVYFTPCATYSNNVSILGRARFCEANGKGRHLITTQIEHPSCLGPAKYLESIGWKVDFLKVNREGVVDPQELKRLITKETSIVSVMWGNNEIGSIQPVKELGELCKEAGVFFHTDAVQIPGKVEIDLKQLHADTLSLSAHKFFGPKGIGALFVRRGSNLMPIAFGGGQEKGIFPGTESVANIVAIGKAAQLAHAEQAETAAYLRKLQHILQAKLETLPAVKFTGPQNIEDRLPGHLSIIVSEVEGESVVLQSDLRGLCVSSASACHKGIVSPSHVVCALGYGDNDALGSVRITAGKFNTEDDCSQAGDILVKIINSLRRTVAPKSSAVGSAK
jgi:cysteine desulfurase